MDYTPRVTPSDTSKLASPWGAPTAPYVQYPLTATYDMSTPEGNFVYLSPPMGVTLPDTSSFSLHVEGPSEPSAYPIVAAQAPWLFDRCAEVRLLSSHGYTARWWDSYAAVAWIWSPETAAVNDPTFNPTNTSGDSLAIISYEGPPMYPGFAIRAGVVAGLSDANQSIAYNFMLRIYRKQQHMRKRISIPSPACMPPFIMQGANAGRFLFGDCATYSYPGKQVIEDQRLFRMKLQQGNIDVGTSLSANLFGGPWRVHVLGGSSSANTTFFIYHRSEDSALATIVDTATGVAASLDSAKNVGAAKVLVTTTEVVATQSTCEIIAEYR